MGAVVVLVIYIVLVLAVGIAASRRSSGSPDEYFLAGRRLGTLVLFMALFGTNATAFVMVGIPGIAYHDGIGVFSANAPITALFTPLTFFLIGVPARRMAMRLGCVTPAELYARRFNAPILGMLLFLFFTLYTLPYMVSAVVGASVILHGVADGAMSKPVIGAGVLLVAVAYTTLGGMRATAWTNVLQGFIFLSFLVAAFFLIASSLGGFTEAMEKVRAHDPSLLKIERTGRMSEAQWTSWGLMISLTVIAFPHMFVRLMAAKSEAAVKSVCRLYPLALLALWLPPVMIGVWGAAAFPGLEGKASDKIFYMMTSAHLPEVLSSLGFLAVLAAVMSSLDAMILTLSSMLTRDVLDRFRPIKSKTSDVASGRIFAVVLAGVVWVLAQFPGSVVDIAKISFQGYVTLVPVLFFGVKWRRFTLPAAMASILAGNVTLWILWLNKLDLLGFMPVFWAFLVALFVAIGVTGSTRDQNRDFTEAAFG